MKLNSETNRLFTILTAVYMGLLTLSIYFGMDKIPVKAEQYPVLAPVVQVLYLLLLVYLIRVLKAAGEKSTIVNAFILYACVRALYTIDKLFPQIKLMSLYLTQMGFLTIVVSVFFFIQLFRIQNKYISLPYRLFGVSLLVTFAFEIAVMFLFLHAPDPTWVKYVRFIDLLIPLAIVFILTRVGAFINEENEQGVQSF